jgi:hypothetical protein
MACRRLQISKCRLMRLRQSEPMRLDSTAHHSRQLAVELEVSGLLCLRGIDEFAKEDIVQSNCAFSPGRNPIAARVFLNDVSGGRHHAAAPESRSATAVALATLLRSWLSMVVSAQIGAPFGRRPSGAGNFLPSTHLSTVLVVVEYRSANCFFRYHRKISLLMVAPHPVETGYGTTDILI